MSVVSIVCVISFLDDLISRIVNRLCGMVKLLYCLNSQVWDFNCNLDSDLNSLVCVEEHGSNVPICI